MLPILKAAGGLEISVDSGGDNSTTYLGIVETGGFLVGPLASLGSGGNCMYVVSTSCLVGERM